MLSSSSSSSFLWPQIEASILPCHSRAPSAVTGEPTPNNYLESTQKTMEEDSSQHAIHSIPLSNISAKVLHAKSLPFSALAADGLARMDGELSCSVGNI